MIHISEEALAHGEYYIEDDIERECPAIMPEWYAWLKTQMDPGHYDAYKIALRIHRPGR